MTNPCPEDLDALHNGYSYANNNPQSNADPSGLQYSSNADADGAYSNLNSPTFSNPYANPALLDANRGVYTGCNYCGHPAGEDWQYHDPNNSDHLGNFLNSLGYAAAHPMQTVAGIVSSSIHDAGSCFGHLSLSGCAMTAATAIPFFKGAKALRDAAEVGDAARAARAAHAANRAEDAVRVCANSFTGGTLVLMADGSKKPIKDVILGDVVMAADPINGERGPRRVLDLIRHSGPHTMVAVWLADGLSINATDHHPFWVVNRGVDGRWVDAIELKSGDQVQTANGGLLVVESTSTRTENLRAYNLTVDDLHTYFVSEAEVLVHNAGCMSSVIGNDPFLVRAAEAGGKSPQVQREMDGLFAQLSAGNMNPGIGTKTLSGTGISYARSRGGARLFFRNVDSGVEIFGKASKANESSVINYLMDLYGP